MNPAIWYLVINLASSSFAPFPTRPALIGPVTEDQCETARKAFDPMPSVLSARCRRVIGAMSCLFEGNPAIGTICPIFEGEISVPVGSYPR
jgi:hypothetical protein